MLLRKVLFVAIAVAPLVLSPTTVEAQNRGLDRATVASADGQERAEAHGRRAHKRHRRLPAGVAKRFEGGPASGHPADTSCACSCSRGRAGSAGAA